MRLTSLNKKIGIPLTTKNNFKNIGIPKQKHVKKNGRLLDAGCGFGRLYPAYENHCRHAILVDYAQNLLDQAKESIHSPNITLSKQSLYDLHVSEPVDVIISIRTLHHLNDVRQLFKQFNLALTNNGTLILDIPNKLHVKNRLRHLLLGRLKELFKPSDTKLGEHFYNYHPTRIINELTKTLLPLPVAPATKR